MSGSVQERQSATSHVVVERIEPETGDLVNWDGPWDYVLQFWV